MLADVPVLFLTKHGQAMKKVIGAIALGVCWFAIGCGGGSQAGQPSQPQVATGSHLLGDTKAQVTIIEFGDFQCPYCKSFYTDTEPQIISTYVDTGKARIAYRQFPLSMHQNAQIAAEASECAAKVGGNDAFWKYHGKLFTNGYGDGTGLDLTSLKQYAADLQLDTASFTACVDQHQTASAVAKDVADGSAAGVHSIPSFFVNGKLIVGAQPFSSFKAVIDSQL